MSNTDQLTQGKPLNPADAPLTMLEIATLLVRHYDLHEGTYDLLLEYQFGVGAVGPNKENLHPGVMVGLSKMGLSRTQEPGPLSVDAAVVNPPTKARKKSGQRP